MDTRAEQALTIASIPNIEKFPELEHFLLNPDACTAEAITELARQDWSSCFFLNFYNLWILFHRTFQICFAFTESSDRSQYSAQKYRIGFGI